MHGMRIKTHRPNHHTQQNLGYRERAKYGHRPFYMILHQNQTPQKSETTPTEKPKLTVKNGGETSVKASATTTTTVKAASADWKPKKKATVARKTRAKTTSRTTKARASRAGVKRASRKAA